MYDGYLLHLHGISWTTFCFHVFSYSLFPLLLLFFPSAVLIGLGLSWIGDVCLLAFGSTFWFTLG